MFRCCMALLTLLLSLSAWAHGNPAQGRDADDPAHNASSCGTADYSPQPQCPQVIGRAYPCEGRGHLPGGSDIPWRADPPHSGAHYPHWEENAGEHDQPVPRGKWVHNLEHGHILLLHNCPQGCEAELELYRETMFDRLETSILITPDPLLTGERFAAVAWTWVYRTDRPELDDLLCFVDQHAGHGPEDLPLH